MTVFHQRVESQLTGRAPAFVPEKKKKWQLNPNMEIPFCFLLLGRGVQEVLREGLHMPSIWRCVYSKFALKGMQLP